MGPVWQNPIKRTVRTAHICVRIIVYNCHTQHSTEQFSLSSLLTSRQASQFRYCLLEGSSHFPGNPIKRFFHKAKIELLSFISIKFSCSCLTIKMASVVPLLFIKLHMVYLNLLPKSVFKGPFHHFHSMFQQFNPSKIHTSMGHLSLCKLVVLHLTSNLLEYNLLSRYYDIKPISTEFQCPLWLVSFLLLALTTLGIHAFSSSLVLQQL